MLSHNFYRPCSFSSFFLLATLTEKFQMFCLLTHWFFLLLDWVCCWSFLINFSVWTFFVSRISILILFYCSVSLANFSLSHILFSNLIHITIYPYILVVYFFFKRIILNSSSIIGRLLFIYLHFFKVNCWRFISFWGVGGLSMIPWLFSVCGSLHYNVDIWEDSPLS
jgi:hypothetical protein